MYSVANFFWPEEAQGVRENALSTELVLWKKKKTPKVIKSVRSKYMHC